VKRLWYKLDLETCSLPILNWFCLNTHSK